MLSLFLLNTGVLVFRENSYYLIFDLFEYNYLVVVSIRIVTPGHGMDPLLLVGA